MPSHFAKGEGSNNYKLLKIVAENSVENRAVYDTILKFWDVDQSQGIGLDRLGKNVGISRGSWNDENYRKMIKIQSILNLSEGDIPTMNLIMEAYMGDSFIGFQDGWKTFGPATLIALINDASMPLPNNILKKIKSAGVGTYWLLNQLMGQFSLKAKSYSFDVPYRITNTFHTADVPGKLAKGHTTVQYRHYEFDVHYPICGTFVTSTINSVQSNLNVELVNEYRNVDVLYKRAGQQTITGEGEI